MLKDPGLGYALTATVMAVKGHCSTEHKAGESFPLSCYHSNGLCGFFYNAIFANLQTFQFDGKLPWWQGDTIFLHCPDPNNCVTIKLERTKR